MVETVDAYPWKWSRSPRPIEEPVTKIGGLPILMEEIEWPLCKDCGSRMDFLVQIRLDTPLKFSSKYHIAYIFMCPSQSESGEYLGCEAWAPFEGANAVILQAIPSGLIAQIIPSGKPAYPDYEVAFEHSLDPVLDMDEDIDDAIWQEMVVTKTGGIPTWVQFDETPQCAECGGNMKFVAQLDFDISNQLPEDQVMVDGKHQSFDFGDAGQGYVFVCENECSPRGAAFLWQCS